MSKKTKTENRFARAHRTHVKARLSGKQRLLVVKSNATIYAQIIDDQQGKVVCGTSGLKSENAGIEMAKDVGQKIAELAQSQKISEVTFDRNGYKYHGQVKALADAARDAGLRF